MADPHDLVRRQFGAHASEYATSRVHAQGESLARLLDVSTGAGHAALTFAPLVAAVVATDLTPRVLEAARRLAADRRAANITFEPADAHALPFEDDAFNLVTSRIALHHYQDAPRAVREMARVCRGGGLVALVDNVVPRDDQTADYVNRFEQLRDPSHHRAYPLEDLEGYFGAAGLRVIHRECLPKEMEFEPWASRMGALEETRARLRQMLLEAPADARAFLKPRADGSRRFFTLTETILVGGKG